MNKLLYLVYFFFALFLTSCDYLSNCFCAGSYCNNDTYQFDYCTPLVSVKNEKMRHKEYDVLERDSSGFSTSKDNYERGTFFIYDDQKNCVVFCEVHSGNRISILSYLYPDCFDEPGDEWECNGNKTKYFTISRYVHYNKYERSKEQDYARQCAEKFFEKLGPYTKLR